MFRRFRHFAAINAFAGCRKSTYFLANVRVTQPHLYCQHLYSSRGGGRGVAGGAAAPLILEIYVVNHQVYSPTIFTHGHRVKFLKTFEFGAQRGEGYRGESALLCSQFQTQF